MRTPESLMKHFTWVYLIVFLAFTCSVIIGGLYYYNYQKRIIVREKLNELASIASLKVDQITQWRKERLGDSNLISGNSFLEEGIFKFFGNESQVKIRNDLIEFMKSIIMSYDYKSIILLDKSQKVRLAYPPQDSVISDFLIPFIAESMKLKRVVFSDLHISDEFQDASLEVLVPLYHTGNRDTSVTGIMILKIDPQNVLFPLVQSWPTPSRTSETLLVRQDGDSVVFLNQLRHQNNTSLRLKLPLSDKSLPAAVGLSGDEGPFEGVDYRNIQVVSHLKKVPDSPWLMVAKVDRTEIFSPLIFKWKVIVIIITLIILSVGLIITLIWRNQNTRYIRIQLDFEQKERKADNKFRILFQNMTQGVYYQLADGTLTDINLAGLRILGLTNNQVIGRDKSHPEWRLVDEKFQTLNPDQYPSILALNSGQEIDKVVGVYVPDSKDYTWVSVNAKPQISESDNKPFQVFVTMHDITELKKADMMIRESEKKFRSLFENAADPILLEDFDGNIMDANPTTSIILGYSLEELKKMKSTDLISDMFKSQVLMKFDILDKKGRYFFEAVHISKNGSLPHFEINSKVIEINGKRLILSIYRDVTIKKYAEIVLRESEEKVRKLNDELEERVVWRTSQLSAVNKELEAFSYSVSHDLRAPLRAIHGFTTILREEYNKVLDKEGKRICSVIESRTVQMGQLIDDLLALSRVGRTELLFSKTSMNAIVSSVYSDLISPEDKEKIIFTVKELPDAYVDASTLKIVWINLVSNALKYSSKKDKSEINIGSEKQDGEIVYYINDNGTGFDMKYSGKLFEVFQRLHSEKEFEGNGVGLAIVHRIITRHGGKVWADAEPGKGATFFFSLPDKRFQITDNGS